ncbi:MAG: hypothetical protein COZ06_33200 [Armatimonadetes bacterium CG_4_10_14_3_um_filter_66_18]|nr:hypothetical protein [Armatimonadota bacterium]OIO96229.1 MAG: hypothetical protein AUJ96_25190 [Armatimonadetes bacterium CG2_30_66_41]PIU94385.1 MAG: hypothetical protein COS65_07725 [Armatimonadetes bacterium CG06_land_8_20_14_3_00_66_21]PIX46315.1 MAG: hypothetical protein COZ57_12520 [Armatimonadetes bacterium CG_4_8_14_3_um_filter_66_20]PIY37268.1 MAG: hypothetical protein COZ06_33200 [Armatimonadetes bacterium CG_4_10_14_3_um_filter_66_18]PIZ33195.1 MAG: hypothetical protein COY42_30
MQTTEPTFAPSSASRLRHRWIDLKPAAWLVAALCLWVPSLAWAEAEAPAATRNVLAAANGGKVISGTSQLDDEYWRKENLIDGLLASQDLKSNGWASKTFSDDDAGNYPQEIVFAVAGDHARLLTKVVIDAKTPDWPLLGRGAKDIEILVSGETADGPWNHVAKYSLLNQGGAQTITFKPTEAKYLMLRVLSNWGSDRMVALGEVEAYEAIMGSGELDQLISRLEQILTDLKRYRDEMQGTGTGE